MHGFPKSDRIRHTSDFEKVKKQGVRVRVKGITIVWLAAEDKRLGLAVPRRAGNAVQRNRIKRVIREHFRLNRELFPQGECVVVAGAGVGEFENREIRALLDQALKKLRTRGNS